jgi:hypothetical protein
VFLAGTGRKYSDINCQYFKIRSPSVDEKIFSGCANRA